MDTDPPNLLIEIFSQNSLLLQGITFSVLLIFSALISASEVALFSLSPTEINAEKESGNPTRMLVAKMLSTPKKLLATILITNNLVNISITLVFIPIGEYLFDGLDPLLHIVLDVGVVAFFILLFGEILPKIYANRNNVTFARFIIKPLLVLEMIFLPFSIFLTKGIMLFNSKLGRQKTNISIGQLSQALEFTSEEETTQEEQKILEGIVSFGNTETREVMRPRIDICAINENLSFPEMLAFIVENGYSRVPVFRENIDTITGIIYAKDLLPYLNETDFDWKTIKRKAIFVPENKKLDDLLSEFQAKKIHLAVVVDEYGGTSGIITMEDIIEEIVGEISDEYDIDDSFFSKIDEKTYLFEGKTPMKDFYKVFGISQEMEEHFEQARGETETIAGFLLEVAGVFPEKGQFIHFENFNFIVENIDEKRIKQIKIISND